MLHRTLQEGASHAVLKKAFFRKSKEWHPDKVDEEKKEEATQMFQRINAAYQVGRAGAPLAPFHFLLCCLPGVLLHHVQGSLAHAWPFVTQGRAACKREQLLSAAIGNIRA